MIFNMVLYFMPTWSEILSRVIATYRDLEVECPQCRDTEYEVAKLPQKPPSEILILSSCTTCILSQVLETIPNIPRIYLSSPLEEVTIYVLDDAVVEVSTESGSVIDRSCVDELLELLESMGFDVQSVREWIYKQKQG